MEFGNLVFHTLKVRAMEGHLDNAHPDYPRVKLFSPIQNVSPIKKNIGHKCKIMKKVMIEKDMGFTNESSTNSVI